MPAKIFNYDGTSAVEAGRDPSPVLEIQLLAQNYLPGKDRTTDFFIYGLYPLHIGDRVLGIVPMLGCASTQLINECFQLVTIHANRFPIGEQGRYNTKTPTSSTQGSRNASPCASAMAHPPVRSSLP